MRIALTFILLNFGCLLYGLDFDPEMIKPDLSEVSRAKTTAATSVAYNRELTRSEAYLNSVVTMIEQKYSANVPFLQALKANQTDWIRYRDSFLNLVFPAKNEEDRAIMYGSDGSFRMAKLRIEITWRRVNELYGWIKVQEVAGSYGMYSPE